MYAVQNDNQIIVQQSFIYTRYFPRDGGGLLKGQ